MFARWHCAWILGVLALTCAAAEPATLEAPQGQAPAVINPNPVTPALDQALEQARGTSPAGEHPVYKLRPIPFSDATVQLISLDELLALALDNNAALRQQGYSIEKSHFVVDQTYYAYDPNLTAGLNYSRQARSTAGTGDTTTNAYSGSFGVTKPFEYGDTLKFDYDLNRTQATGAGSTTYGSGYAFSYTRPLARGAGKYIHRIPRYIASNNTELAYSKLDDDVRKLKQNIVDTYYQAVAVREGINVRQSAIELALKQLERSVERFKAGLAIEADVLQSENSVLSQRSGLLTAENNYKSLLDQLTTLVGVPQEYLLAVDTKTALTDLGGDVPEDLWVLVQENSYELKSLNTSLANLRLNMDQQLHQLKPDLGLNMSYSRSGTDTNMGRAVSGLENNGLQIGLNWSATPGQRATKADVAQTQLDLTSLELQIRDAELKLQAAVRALQRDLETKREQISLAESNLDVLRKTYDIQSERNTAGLATALDVIEAQENVLNGELALLQAKVSYQETYRGLLVMAGLL